VRRRLALTVLAVVGMVMVAFLLPLAVLVRVVAEDRALSAAEQEARYLAGVLAAVEDRTSVDVVLGQLNTGKDRSATVWLADGSRLGATVNPPADELVLARGGRSFTSSGGGARRVWVPVRQSDGTTAAAAVTVPGTTLHRGVARAWTILGLLGLVLALLAVAVADRLARAIVAPIEDLGRVTARLQHGDLAARVEPRGPPEVVEVGHTVNRLAGRIGELLADEREAVADLSHRLRTPLTALQLEAEGLHDPDERARLSGAVAELTDAVTAVIQEARRPPGERISTPADLGAVVSDRMAFWSVLAEDQQRHWSLDLAAGQRPVAVPTDDLVAVVDALLANVFNHTPEGTAFRVAVGPAPGGNARLVVEDEGPGFPAGAAPARGRSGAGSTGLGLDIAFLMKAQADYKILIISSSLDLKQYFRAVDLGARVLIGATYNGIYLEYSAGIGLMDLDSFGGTRRSVYMKLIAGYRF